MYWYSNADADADGNGYGGVYNDADDDPFEIGDAINFDEDPHHESSYLQDEPDEPPE